MYRIAICDDDEKYIDYLEELFKKRLLLNSDETAFYRYNSGESLVNDLNNNIPFNLLILDMQLKSLSGDDTAKLFREKYPDALLVFCSGALMPSVKSFEVNAYRYLLKKYDIDQMTKELVAVVSEMRRRADIPAIKVIYKNDVQEVPLDSILYVSIRKHGCCIHVRKTDDKTVNIVLCNKRINEVFDEVEKYDFAYAHNSYFINLKFVRETRKHNVELVDGTILPIARSKEKNFREMFVNYLGKKY